MAQNVISRLEKLERQTQGSGGRRVVDLTTPENAALSPEEQEQLVADAQAEVGPRGRVIVLQWGDNAKTYGGRRIDLKWEG